MKTRLFRKAVAAALPLLSISACAPLPGNGGYIGTEASSWSAFHNRMPGAEPQIVIRGEVTVAAANYAATLNRRPGTMHPPEYDLTVRQGPAMGAQVLTRQEVIYRDPYKANVRRIVIHFPDGRSLRVRVRVAH